MANEGYHEPINELTDETRDMHRAISSLMEELEAIDWYNQRVDACKDEDLKAILAHNRHTIVTKKKNMPPWCLNGSDEKIQLWTKNSRIIYLQIER